MQDFQKGCLRVAIASRASETELIIRAKNGDHNAFSELVCIHASGVRNVIFRMCGDAHVAEDAAQEAFIRAWLAFASYRPQASLKGWLYRIAVNAATDLLRKEKRILPGALEEMPLKDPRPGPEALLSQGERAASIQNTILSLPDACRAVLVLREYEGLSYHEIADALDLPLGTVMSRLSYARKLLKGRLDKTLFLPVEAEHV